jgi:hypothetical protein
MIVGERFYATDINLRDQSPNLVHRDFMKTLFEKGSEKCVEYLGQLNKEDGRTCRNEIMVAASCVLMYKANNRVGDFRDNVGLCRQEIDLSKKYLKEKFENFPEERYDDWLGKLSLSTKTFV